MLIAVIMQNLKKFSVSQYFDMKGKNKMDDFDTQVQVEEVDDVYLIIERKFY